MSNEIELKYTVIMNSVEKVISAIKLLGVTSIISFALFKCVEVLAGKETLANIDFKVLGNFNVAFSFTVALSGISVLGWIRENKKRKADIKRLTQENKDLKKQLDAKVSSSMLEKDGTTNRSDL